MSALVVAVYHTAHYFLEREEHRSTSTAVATAPENRGLGDGKDPEAWSELSWRKADPPSDAKQFTRSKSPVSSLCVPAWIRGQDLRRGGNESKASRTLHFDRCSRWRRLTRPHSIPVTHHLSSTVVVIREA